MKPPWNAMCYEFWLEPEELMAYRKGKDIEHRVADVGKQVAAEMTGGRIETGGKNFLATPIGRYRLASRGNSDNTTEARDLLARGVRTIILNQPDKLRVLFREHDLEPGPSIKEFYARVERKMDDPDNPPLFQ